MLQKLDETTLEASVEGDFRQSSGQIGSDIRALRQGGIGHSLIWRSASTVLWAGSHKLSVARLSLLWQIFASSQTCSAFPSVSSSHILSQAKNPHISSVQTRAVKCVTMTSNLPKSCFHLTLAALLSWCARSSHRAGLLTAWSKANRRSRIHYQRQARDDY